MFIGFRVQSAWFSEKNWTLQLCIQSASMFFRLSKNRTSMKLINRELVINLFVHYDNNYYFITDISLAKNLSAIPSFVLRILERLWLEWKYLKIGLDTLCLKQMRCVINIMCPTWFWGIHSNHNHSVTCCKTSHILFSFQTHVQTMRTLESKTKRNIVLVHSMV